MMQNKDISAMNTDDAAVISLRKCGHYLHHSASKDQAKTNAELVAALTDDEKKTLIDLLQKCLKSWQA